MSYRFEWDDDKARSNQTKHGITFDEAATVFEERIMKKPTPGRIRSTKPDEMLPEYDFDYQKAKPNRFAGRISKECVVVLLDPEVSEVFTTPESVNTVLRALIAAMPEDARKHARRK